MGIQEINEKPVDNTLPTDSTVSKLTGSDGKEVESRNLVFRLYENRRAVDIPRFEESYPDELQGSIIIDGRIHRFKLTKNTDLLSANYKEVYYENNQRVVRGILPSDWNSFCHYNGKIQSDGDSYVTLNLCDGSISGTLYTAHGHYVIDGRNLHPLRDQELSSATYIRGRASNTSSNIHLRRKRGSNNKQPSYYSKYLTWKDLYVEMAVVFDNSMYKKYGMDKKRLFQRARDLVNLINAYYQPIRIKVALTGVEIWSEGDRVVINTSGDGTLDQFLRYRKVNLIHDIPNDHAQLLTNVTFIGGVVGKAMKGTMCSTELSGAVVMDHDRFRSLAPIAGTMAHEMGHNFGMEHDSDSCECPHQRCLMAASSSGAGNVYWSSCSMEYLSWSLSRGADYCLRNKPPTAKDPICGNGFVEDGEECDCGLPEVCDNPCCNAANCRFASGAVCANGACCDLSTCQFSALATVCRQADNECDLPEFCNGKSETCPKNTYKQNGTPCKISAGFCYNGTCGNQDDQCRLIWGATGQAAEPLCYDGNTKGAQEGHCGINSDRSFVRCDNEDKMCGLLQCAQKTERTSYGDRSVVRVTSTLLHLNDRTINCHTAMIDLGMGRPNPGMVPSGTKCGDGKMCVKQKCVAVSNILAVNPCSSNCHDSGVCNNYGHCHCISGYGGVDCSIPGLGGSIDSGPASTGTGRFNLGIGILVFLLVVLPLVTAIVTCLYRKGIIKSRRLKVIDLLFKPRATKRRQGQSPRGADLNRPHAFDSTTIGRRAQPILAYSVDASSHSPQRLLDPENDLQSSAVPGHTANVVTSNSWNMDKESSSNMHRESTVQLEPPPVPARLSETFLERLYYTDVAASPRIGYASDIDPTASLLGEVLSAVAEAPTDVEEGEYGHVILPQRRAPPPPATIEEEPVEIISGILKTVKEEPSDGSVKDEPKSGSTKEEPRSGSVRQQPKTGSVKQESKTGPVKQEPKSGPPVKEDESANGSVKAKKRLFESAAKLDPASKFKGPAKDNGGQKMKVTDKKKTLEISQPLEPKISGEPVTQSTSLLIVPHLESQTLPRKNNNCTAVSNSTVTGHPSRQLYQRKSSAVDECTNWKQRQPASASVQRSHSTVASTARPTTAPPPPPKSIGSRLVPPKNSSFLCQDLPPSTKLQQAQKDLRESFSLYQDSESAVCNKVETQPQTRSSPLDTYYDVIASPMDDRNEEIYADIDEFRTTLVKAPPPAVTMNPNSSSPNYRTLHPSKPGVKQ